MIAADNIPLVDKFIKYPDSVRVLYNMTGDEYKLPGGWNKIPTETTVIGEDENLYVEEIRESVNHGQVSHLPKGAKYRFTVGFHKSRLIKWLPTQLSLFE